MTATADSTEYTSIKEWAAEDRPREKLLNRGVGALTNSEILAILIRSGSQKLSAVQTAQQILENADHNLAHLSRFSISDLCKIKGIGEAKALSIVAALELGRRRLNDDFDSIQKITSSKDAYDQLRGLLMDAAVEHFYVLFLSRSNKPMRPPFELSRGGTTATVVDIKILFKEAINLMANGIILAHNHPSGNLKPSNADISLTRKIVEAAQHFDIQVLDHLIVTEGNGRYLSFADEGIMPRAHS